MVNARITLQHTNTILYCHHWAETARFYKEQMGFPVSFENDWFIEFQLTGTSFLSIANSARATVSAVGGQGITLTWKVVDLAKIKEELETQGIITTQIQQKWGAWTFYCTDPEGHRLEFWADTNKKGDDLNE